MAKFKVGDKVRILDGSKIPNYAGSWNKEDMGNHIGKVYKIEAVREHWGKSPCAAYLINGYIWDERGLALATEHKAPKIVITSDDKTTTATLYEGRQKIKSAEAKCAPSDIFDFNYGASLALDRLTGFVHGSVDNTLTQMDRFLTGEIGLEVPMNKTFEFLKECEKLGLRWYSGDKPTAYDPSAKYFVCEDNHLFFSAIGRENSDYIWEKWNGAKSSTKKEKIKKKLIDDVMSAIELYIKLIKDDLDD